MLTTLDPLRHQLRAILGDQQSQRTWLVGGVVRDALIGRPLVDADIVIDGDVEAVARAIAKAENGTTFPLGDRLGAQHGCWRIVKQSNSACQFDVCKLRGGSTIEEDLALRDYCANAMAVPVGSELCVIDPYHGLADIRDQVVRMVSPTSLDDDPLRMLRAARLAHQLGWDIEAKTVSAISDRAARIGEPAGERIFYEMQLILGLPEARRGWRILEKLGLDRVLLPELEACRGMKQSRFHHLDVRGHTLAVLDNCEDILEATEFWLATPRDELLRVPSWSNEQRITVLLAALCHDLGKPATRSERSDGRVGFAGHDQVGCEIVDDIAKRWRWSSSLRRSVRLLVGTHLALGYLLHGDQGLKERWKLRRVFGELTPEAVALSLGDRLATAGPDDRRRWVRAHMQLAHQVWLDHWREQRDGVPQPLLNGSEIAEAVGIEPGPRVGDLVESLALAQAAGEVESTDQARELVIALYAQN